jgi:hypothetical protein
MPITNIRLAEKVLRHLESPPPKFKHNQNIYCDRRRDPEGNICGTEACIAGATVLLSRSNRVKVQWRNGGGSHDWADITLDGYGVPWSTAAGNLLGLTPEEEGDLFQTRGSVRSKNKLRKWIEQAKAARA